MHSPSLHRKMSARPSHFSASASLVCSSWSSLFLIISTIEVNAVNAFPVLLSSNHQRRRMTKTYLFESRFATAHLLPRHRSSSTVQGAGPNPFVNDEYAAGGFFPPSNQNGGGDTSSPFDNSDENPDNNGQYSMSQESGQSPNPFLRPTPAMANSFGDGSGPPAGGEQVGFGGGDPFSPSNHRATNNNNGFGPSTGNPPTANPFGGGGPAAQTSSAGDGSGGGFGPPPTMPSFPGAANAGIDANSVSSSFQQQTSQSPFGQSGQAGAEQTNNSSPFGAGPSSPPPPSSFQQNESMAGTTLSMQPPPTISGPSASPPEVPSVPVADDTWVEFTIHPGHIPDPAFMTITSTDYSSAIPRGLVLRTGKPGTRFGQTMTEKAQVVVSLGAEPMGQGDVDATEEPEKVWDLGPGEYVVNRGTRLDKTRMYVMDFEISTTRPGGAVLRTVNPGIVDEWGNNVRLCEVIVSGGPDGKWREPKPQMEGMEGIVGNGMMDGRGGAMGGLDGGSDRVSRGFVSFSGGSLGPARRGGDDQGGQDGYTYGPAPPTGGDPYSMW